MLTPSNLAQASFEFLQRISNTGLLNKISVSNKQHLLNALCDYSFNPNEGALQHKAGIVHMVFRDKFNIDNFQQYYKNRYPDSKVEFASDVSSDLRILAELPVIRKYEEAFHTDIKRILVTADTIATTFDKQMQSNPDILVDIASRYGFKQTYQDIKSGMNITKHSSGGSLGLLTYDSNGHLIPFTSKHLDLHKLNKDSVLGIRDGFKHDGIVYEPFNEAIKNSIKELDKKQTIFQTNVNIQHILWSEIHIHPLYNRSIAFTFTDHQNILMYTDKHDVYKKRFISLLSTKNTYDVNSIADRKQIFNAMLQAYKEVDRDAGNKFSYLVKEVGMQVDQHFLHVMAALIRDGLL